MLALPVVGIWLALVLPLPAQTRPNIVIIMSDDMGYSDIGCYGGEIQTPHLDALADDGLRFTQFYNTGRCCPTRASLLTGLYPHQTGIGHMVHNGGTDSYRGDLNRRCVTIAEVLRPAGYATYCVGKWHVTPPPTKPNSQHKHNWPMQRGFDRYYGIINGASSLWDPNSLVRGNKQITCKADAEYDPDEPYHFTDAISDNAVKFIDKHSGDKPFFMYVAYTAAHWPMHARPRDIDKYQGKYDDGYKPISKARLTKMKRLGLVSRDIDPAKMAGDWGKVKCKTWEADRMEVYAAMVDQMDQGIGRIVDKLRDRDQLENTLILFLQDNGACAEQRKFKGPPTQRPPAPTLPPIPDEVIGYFQSVPTQTRDGYPVRRGRVTPGPADTYIEYGRKWASVSNTPFREYKHWVHEGGIATPLIAHWPAGFSARGELRHHPSHLIDLMATCVDLAAAEYPAEYAGKQILSMEGVSLRPAFADKSLNRDTLYWEHEGNRAVRYGDWKLVAKGKHRQDNVKWELYNLANDRGEQHDLASSQPKQVAKLKALWQAYAERTGVVPWPKGRRR